MVLILAGVIALVEEIVAPFVFPRPQTTPPLWIIILSLIGLAAIPLPVVAGLLAYKRSAWAVAVGCAALGLLTIGIYFETTILSLIGLILLVRRRSLFIS